MLNMTFKLINIFSAFFAILVQLNNQDFYLLFLLLLYKNLSYFSIHHLLLEFIILYAQVGLLVTT